VAAVADELLADRAGPALATDALPPGSGHPTEVDVRAVIVRDRRVLLVREHTDSGWAMPGSWPQGSARADRSQETPRRQASVRATRLRPSGTATPRAWSLRPPSTGYLAWAARPAAEPVPG
jgi:hypothetical protein